MNTRRALRILIAPAVAVAAAALVAAPAAATTIVPLSDAALVAQSPLVVVGRVEGTLPASHPGPYTDWLVTVQRVLKGEISDGAIVVRVLGGETADGDRLTIYGAPRFEEREKALLFLAPRRDGTWGVAQFLQGAFHAVRAGARTVAVRDLSEVNVVPNRRSARRNRTAPPRLRDFGAFADWIEDRAAGRPPAREYFFRPSPSQMSAIIGRFTLFEHEGKNLRWFEFDSGGSVTWRAHQSGQPGLASGGFPEFQRSLGAWNAEGTTPVQLVYGGTTTVSAGFQSFDRHNVLLFNDPNQDIEGTFDCDQGGTLAIGGPWSDSSVTGRFNGRVHIKILAADVVMNDGIECSIGRSRNGSKFMEEVYAHEVGHTLGLGHSSENAAEANRVLRDALMFFRAHDDGRGARLNSDDVAGLQALYKRAGGGGGGGGGNGACPAGALCFLANRFEATLTWENQFNPGETGVGKPIQYSEFAGFFHFSDDPRNIELVVKVVDYGGRILVFYSELTKIQFRLRVTDKSTGQTKEYTNTAGDCGAIDTDFVQPGTQNLTTGGPASVIRDLGVTEPPGRACAPASDTLCLIGNRFKVRLPVWTSQFDGSTGRGITRPLNDLAGAFHFSPDPRNLEIFFKMNEFPDRFLVFFGSLSVFDYTLHLTDTETGRTIEFRNPTGRYCGGFVNDLLAGPPF